MSAVRRLNFGTGRAQPPMSPTRRRNIISTLHKIEKLEKNQKNIAQQWRALANNDPRRNELANRFRVINAEIWGAPQRRGGTYKQAIREELAARQLRSQFRRRASPLLRAFREKGLEKEKARALANFAQFQLDPRGGPTSPPRRKSPPKTSPQKTAQLRSPATLAREAALGIMGGFKHSTASPNNSRITWSRTPSGRISIHKTLANLNLKLTNAQRNAILTLPENQAVNILRKLSRLNVGK